MRYYSTQRPCGPGTFPRAGGTETVVNFNEPVFCTEIRRYAWRYIDYPQGISDEQAERYELTPGNGGTGSIVVVRDNDGRLIGLPDTEVTYG